jgi:glycosyltransferase involved in cell wall biosynthesis
MICTCGLSALRALRMAAPKTKATVIVRKPIPADRCRCSERLLSRWELWLLRRADHILVSSNTEAARCQLAGLPTSKISIVSPGVRPLTGLQPLGRRHILCAGRLLPHKGFYDAIWTFDILCYLYDDMELTIVGGGPERRRLEQFAQGTGRGDRIHFPGAVADISRWLERAALVWIPSLADTGVGVALEAMAAARPVIAARWPSLMEFVSEGQTGFLIEPGNKLELAEKTRHLLDDLALRQRMGDAGRRCVEERYSAGCFMSSWQKAAGNAA